MGVYDELSKLDDAPVAAHPQRRSAGAGRASHPKSGTAAVTGQQRLQPSQPDETASGVDDVMTHVTTSRRHDVPLAAWHEVLTHTETRNSALRLTVAERERAEDFVRDLQRTHRISTSMNELARLGLLLLERDFRTQGVKSIIHRVKKS